MSQKPGDILVLADEVPISFLRIEAYRTAGKALLKLGRYSLALEQTEKALAINPDDIESCQQKGTLLERLNKHNASKEWLKATIKKHPESSEIWSLLGHIEKNVWINSWSGVNKTSEEMKKAAVDDAGLLREAINCYIKGFLLNPGHYYSGINAITLSHLLRYLTKKNEDAETRKALEGGVCWAVKSALVKETPDSKDYWGRVTLADLEVLTGDTPDVEKAYKHAIAAAEKDWFALDSSRQQLFMLGQLGFRPDQVSAAIKIFDLEIEKLKPPETQWEPRMVFLFSGHMIDSPDRAEPRFPADKESIAAEAIAAKLDELGAGKEDLALCGGACGGDLLFAEACIQRGVRLELRIPFEEPTFLSKSVTFAGDEWRDRFYKVKNHKNTHLYVMPDEIGVSPPKVNPYSRNNLWQLYTALVWGPEKVHFICLWNRKDGDGPGGTKHMYDEVSKHFGQVHVLDTNKLFKKVLNMPTRNPYCESLKKDMGSLIDELDLSDLQKHFLHSRWLDQVTWMEGKTDDAQKRYYLLRLTSIVGGVIIPSLVSLNINNEGIDGFIRWATFTISLLVAICLAIEEFFNYGERWRHYRRTVENLKIEGWQLFQLSGGYKDFKSHAEAYTSFAAKVEDILRDETNTYISEIVKEKAKNQADSQKGTKN